MSLKRMSMALMASLSVNASALELSGTVRDAQGRYVKGAEVSIAGGFGRVKTDEQGRFSVSVDSDHAELHVAYPGMIHETAVFEHDRSDLVFQLSPSLIEQVDVIGTPLHLSTLESAQPVSVISGEALREQQAATLGETLRHEVGVHSSFYGSVASSPIIRGLDGPRVLIAQNGLAVGDASRIGPDHIVTTESSTAKQIEILRGPSTLFFGSGAIGGVVNVVDNRVPRNSDTEAHIFSAYNSVSDENELSAMLKGGNDHLALYVDGFVRDAKDYEIPSHSSAEHEDEDAHEGHAEDKVENSASESSGFTLGSSWLFENGFIGVSYGYLDRLNGIPGHAHEAELEGEESEAEHEEAVVESDLEQDRWQLLSEWDVNAGWLKSLSARAAYTDYEHVELEDGLVGTRFQNELIQLRSDMHHVSMHGWLGALSVEFKNEKLSAKGEEAFTPASESEALAFSIMEEKHFGDVLFQSGFRVEEVSLDATEAEIHHHEEPDGEDASLARHLDFSPISVSAGFVWEFSEGYNASLSLTHAERAPNPSEVFSFGPHIGTRSYEIGALYAIEEEAGEYHVEATNRVSKESSNNIDVGLRKFDGRFGFVLNAFYNTVSDFYYLSDTGLTSDVLLEEAPLDGEDAHAHAESLPVFVHRQEDATLYGFEAEFIAALNTHFRMTVMADRVRAELDDGGNLPRIPPARVGVKGEWFYGNWTFSVDGLRHFEQDNIALNETVTEAYTLYNAKLAYRIDLKNMSVSAFLKGDNLSDEYAQVHSSFLKDETPLPGRAYRLGLSLSF